MEIAQVLVRLNFFQREDVNRTGQLKADNGARALRGAAGARDPTAGTDEEGRSKRVIGERQDRGYQ